MPKKGHTEEQIVAVLRQAEAGEKVSPRNFDCNGLAKHGVSCGLI